MLRKGLHAKRSLREQGKMQYWAGRAGRAAGPSLLSSQLRRVAKYLLPITLPDGAERCLTSSLATFVQQAGCEMGPLGRYDASKRDTCVSTK